jgi:hypothetical protein
MPNTKERANFTLSGSVKAELEQAIPKSKRSQFVERAIADALLVEAKRKALAAIDNAPCYDTNGQNSVERLRQIRSERAGTIISRHQSADT